MISAQVAENLRKYWKKGTLNARPHINAVYIHPGNSIEHELAKFMIGFIAANGGDVHILYNNQHLQDALGIVARVFRKISKSWLFPNGQKHFITEAKRGNSVYDIVILESDERIEIDGAHADAKKKEATHYIIGGEKKWRGMKSFKGSQKSDD